MSKIRKRKAKTVTKPEDPTSMQPCWLCRGSCLSRLWSIRSITSCCFFVSLTIMGFAVTLIGLIFGYRSITTVTRNNGMLIDSLIDTYVGDWLGQGELSIGAIERHLLWMEVDEGHDVSFRGHPPSVYAFQMFSLNYLYSLRGVNKMCCATKYGSLVGASITPRGAFLAWTDETTMDYPTCCSYNETHQPGPLHLRPPGNGKYFNLSAPFDFRVVENGWYSKTVNNPETTLVWNTNLGNSEYITSVSKKAFSANGTFIGVISTAFIMDDFHRFLKNLVEKVKIGSIFVVDETGSMISNTENSPVFKSHDDDLTHSVTRVKPEECENSLISSVSKKILARYGGNWSNTVTTNGSFARYGSSLVQIIRPEVSELSFSFVYVAATWDVYREIINVGIVSVASIFSINGLFVFFCIVFVILVTKPLFEVVKQMKKIEQMDLDDVKVKRTFLFEVRALQVALLFTVAKLRDLRTFLPISLTDNPEFADDDEKEVEQGSTSEIGDNVTVDGVESNESNGSECGSDQSEQSSNSGVVLESQWGVDSKNPFELRLRETTRLIVIIFIENLITMLSDCHLGHESVISFTRSVYDEIIRLTTGANGGKMNEYGLDSFSITFRNKIDGFKVLEPLKRSFEMILEKFPILKIKIGVIDGKVWLGNIGNDRLKKGIVWGNCSKFMMKKLSEYESKGSVDVLVDESFAKHAPVRFILKPVQLCEGYSKTRPFVVLNRIDAIVERGGELEDLEDKYRLLRDSCTSFFLFASFIDRTPRDAVLLTPDHVERPMKKYLKKNPKDLEASVFGFQLRTAMSKILKAETEKKPEL